MAGSRSTASRGGSAAVHVRNMTLRDIEAVAALNRVAYPTLAEDDIVWSPAQLESHLRVFPDGQLVAVVDGRIVGSASSLVVHLGQDPYRDHTWSGVTDSGWFTCHDPRGDTLYGADVCVHPDTRGRGIAATMYARRRELCRSLNLRRIVLGGRLHGYGKVASRMSPEEYARRVESGDGRDLVLSFQLRQGFVLRKVMPHYLADRRSRNYATFLEWLNPGWTVTPGRRRTVRVSCVQYRMRKLASFKGFEGQVAYFTDVAADSGAEIVLFPELLTAQLMSYLRVKAPLEAIRRLTRLSDRVDALFSSLAARHDVTIVGGSHPRGAGRGRIENVASLYLPDGTVHRQPKLHITPNERRWWGIDGGSTLQAFDTPAARVGVLICYDVEFPETARVLADQGAEILLVPYCTNDRQGHLRVRYCAQARAVENHQYVATAGNVGNLPAVENMDINYAQSAVLTPSDFAYGRDGIQVEASANTETVITCDLDLDLLREGRETGTVTPMRDRRRDLFRLSGPGDAAGGAEAGT